MIKYYIKLDEMKVDYKLELYLFAGVLKHTQISMNLRDLDLKNVLRQCFPIRIHHWKQLEDDISVENSVTVEWTTSTVRHLVQEMFIY